MSPVFACELHMCASSWSSMVVVVSCCVHVFAGYICMCIIYIYYTWACVYTNIYIYTYTPVYIYIYICICIHLYVYIYIYIHVLVVVLSCTVVAWIPRFRGLAPPRGLCCFSGGISKGSLPAHWGRPSTQPWGINQQWLDICGNIYI